MLRAATLSEGRRQTLEAAQTVLQGQISTQGQTLEQMARDIAERNRELEDSRRRLYITLKSIGDAVIVTDAEGGITFMNQVAENLTGWNIHEAATQKLPTVFRVVNQRSRQEVENPFEKVRRTKGVVGLANHTLLLSRDGREICIDDSGAPILDSDGQLNGVILIFRDISDRRRAEEAQTLLASIVDSSDDAIISRDLNFKVTSWNKGAERLYGYTAEEAKGRGPELTVPAELRHEITMFEEDLKASSSIRHWQSKRLTKDGRQIDVSMTISPIYDYMGRLSGAASIARDITTQKQTEEALRTSEKLAATGRLAATIAHEINNPLEAVTNLLYLIDLETKETPPLNEYVQQAQTELQRVSHITRQTLAFYRDTTNPVVVNVRDLVDNIIEIYRHNIQEKSIQVTLSVPPELNIEGLPGELRQVFSNLIRNAIDAVREGEEISVKAAAGHSRTIHISVVDTGPGIKPENQARIFDAFFTTKGVNGTGLGLWVSQGIVQKHGGTIKLTSPLPGRSAGAEFTVSLPERAAFSECA